MITDIKDKYVLFCKVWIVDSKCIKVFIIIFLLKDDKLFYALKYNRKTKTVYTNTRRVYLRVIVSNENDTK